MSPKERNNALLRALDRYLGIPLVFLLGLLKGKKRLPTKRDKIALLLTSGIGDTVLLSGIVQDLKEAYPQAEITLFSGASNYEMASLLPGIHAIPLPILHPIKAIKEIRQKNFDMWIDCNPWPRINALFSFFAKTEYRIGFKTEGEYRHFVYDAVIAHQKGVHELDNFRKLLKALNISGYHPPKISIKDTEEVTERKEVFVFHLFAGGSRAYLKEWPQDKWIELIDRVTEKNIQIALTGSQADKKRLSPLKLRCRFPDKVEVVAGTLSLRETALLLKTATATVSIDTGIMHLAAAMGCPLISLHGPTSFKRWGAIGETVIPLTSPKPYVPCIHLGFEKICRENQCMQNIEVSQVMLTLKELKLLPELSQESCGEGIHSLCKGQTFSHHNRAHKEDLSPPIIP